MPLTPIFHPQEDWYQAMVTKNKGSLKATNRQEEWYEEIVDSMSSGSGGGVLTVHLAYDEDTGKTVFDKTWKEVYDADSVSIIAKDESSSFKNAYVFVSMGNSFPSGKYVKVINPESVGNTITFVADSENGYPSAMEG